MPVFFYIGEWAESACRACSGGGGRGRGTDRLTRPTRTDPEFATNPYMDGIDTITLSYTFFSVDESEVADVLRELQAQNPHQQLN